MSSGLQRASFGEHREFLSALCGFFFYVFSAHTAAIRLLLISRVHKPL